MTTEVKTSSIRSGSIIGHYVIIWLDSDIHHAEENTKNSFDNIRHLIDPIKIFINLDQCIHFLNRLKKSEIFLIIAHSFEQDNARLTNLIDETIQINSVYIFSPDLSIDQHWQNPSPKLQGTFTQIQQISHALERIICPCEDEPSSTSLITTNDDLDPSSIYTKLFTQLIDKFEYDDQAKKDAFDFCREYYADNQTKLVQINEMEENYRQHSPVWWYTCETPINAPLQSALITQNFDLILKMGVFIQDLHREIKRIYLERNRTEEFIVYRGQGMSKEKFDEFIERKGGLYTFHNFISTSIDEETGLHFAKCANTDGQMIGILFQMVIDPSICPVLFAPLDKTSYYLHRENEILFSTGAIFRIDQIEQIDEQLWKVYLTIPCDIERQLYLLTDPIRQEIEGMNVRHSLALFFHRIGKYNRAMEIFNRMIEEMADGDQEQFMTMLASTDNNIALMHHLMENYPDAIVWYEKALEIQEKSLPPDHPSLAIVYNNLGMAYREMGNYRRALSLCDKSLDIRLKSSADKLSLVTNYSNLGMIYESKGDYTTALSYYEEAFQIQQSSLPPQHISLTLSYNNFGGIYSLTGEYSKALWNYEKTSQIQSKYLLPNHPSLAITYNNLAHIYQLMGNYRMSLSYYEDALQIQENIISSNHLSLATTYNNIGLVHRLLEDHTKALAYYEKALTIEEKSLPSDHPSLAYTYNNLGAVHHSIGEHSTALTYYNKAHEIFRRTLAPNHPSLAAIYNNMGSAYESLKDYNCALLHYQKSIDVLRKSLTNPLDLATAYNNIGEVYRSKKEYANALSYYQTTLEIEQEHLSPKHPSLAITLSNMAVALDGNNQSEEALQRAQQALKILTNALGLDHPQTKNTQNFLEQLRQKLTDSS